MGQLLRYIIPKTKELELARFHYYLRNQQKFINFKHYALVALENYLIGEPKILIKLDVSAPNKYVFNKDISIYINDERMIQLLNKYCALTAKKPNIVFKEAIYSSLEFTEDQLWVSPAVYIKSYQPKSPAAAPNQTISKKMQQDIALKVNPPTQIEAPIAPDKPSHDSVTDKRSDIKKNPYINQFTIR